MDHQARFLKIVSEMFTWAGALPHLLNRIGTAMATATISLNDKAQLLLASRRIGDLFKEAGVLMEKGNLDELAAVTDQLREQIVKATLILDRLKVPDLD
jgi:hypothetical protein